MKRSFAAVVLGAAVLSIAMAGCTPGESAQLIEVRGYIEKIQPISDSLEKEGTAFETAMSQEGAPDAAALGSIRGSLQTSIDTLKDIAVTDPKIKEAHAHLIAGITALQSAVGQLVAILATPDSAPPDFDQQLEAQMSIADTEIDLWMTSIAAMLPEAERAAFIQGTK